MRAKSERLCGASRAIFRCGIGQKRSEANRRPLPATLRSNSVSETDFECILKQKNYVLGELGHKSSDSYCINKFIFSLL